MSTGPATLEQAYASCERLARLHYENFPVASWMLPKEMRHHVAAVYAFARRADDFADEGERSDQERHVLLDDWLRRLDEAVGASVSEDPDDRDLLFVALANTIRDRDLPPELFVDLVSAFRQDVTVCRYRTWEELLDYCRRSANPVGRLVLRIAGVRDPRIDALSDDVCTALQLTNFLQDLGHDWAHGRLYMPAEVQAQFGAREEDLGPAPLSAPWRKTLAEVSERTVQLFDQGRAVCDGVGGRLGVELRLTWLGGRRILARLEQSGYDPLVSRPRLGFPDSVPLLWHALVWHS